VILSRLPETMPAEETLTSRANPLYKRLRALKERGAERDLCLLEGPTLVLEALAASVVVVEAAAAPRAEAAPRGALALAQLREHRVKVRRMTADLLASLSEAETSQGLIALARRPSFDEARLFRDPPLVLVVEGVQNPGNLGGLLRTAEAAGATGALLTTGSADPFSWKALRGSMGSAFRLPHRGGLPISEALEALAARGVRVFATAKDGERRYDEADLRGPTALVVGSEGQGLSPEVRQRAFARLRVPLSAPVESLNVGVAAALVLFEAARQRGFPPPGSRG
jgi:RNA methyltransferase, TrmH family